MAEVPYRLLRQVEQAVMADLQPSMITVYLKSGLAVLVGGILSLFMCGQFGVAFAHSAHHVHEHMHSGIGCMLLCGMIFSVAPVIMLRLVCSPLQFRAITRKGFHAPLIWIAGTGAILAYHGDHGRDVLSFIMWCVAAWGTFEIFSITIDYLGKRQFRLQPL